MACQAASSRHLQAFLEMCCQCMHQNEVLPVCTLLSWLQVFLLSTRAGGAGLNLIGANHLVGDLVERFGVLLT